VIGYGLGFGSCLGIDGVNDGISEIIESTNNLSNDSLVREVLVGCQCNESLDHWGHSRSGFDLAFDVLQGVLESLDLEKGWVGECFKEGKGIIDSRSGIV
jgi:hypothetical protein